MKEYTKINFGEEAVALFGDNESTGSSSSPGKINMEGIETDNLVPKSIKFGKTKENHKNPLYSQKSSLN